MDKDKKEVSRVLSKVADVATFVDEIAHIRNIKEHYSYYFTNTGKTFKDTNGEFVESLHNSLRLHEESHRMKVVRKLGTPGHMKISQASLAPFNVKKAGFSPAQSFSLRQKSSPQCLTLSEWCYYY